MPRSARTNVRLTPPMTVRNHAAIPSGTLELRHRLFLLPAGGRPISARTKQGKRAGSRPTTPLTSRVALARQHAIGRVQDGLQAEATSTDPSSTSGPSTPVPINLPRILGPAAYRPQRRGSLSPKCSAWTPPESAGRRATKSSRSADLPPRTSRHPRAPKILADARLKLAGCDDARQSRLPCALIAGSLGWSAEGMLVISDAVPRAGGVRRDAQARIDRASHRGSGDRRAR